MPRDAVLSAIVADGNLAGWSYKQAKACAVQAAAHALATGNLAHCHGAAVASPDGVATVWRRLVRRSGSADAEGRGPAYPLMDERFGKDARREAWKAVRAAHEEAVAAGKVFLRAASWLPVDEEGRRLALAALELPAANASVLLDWLEERGADTADARKRLPGQKLGEQRYIILTLLETVAS